MMEVFLEMLGWMLPKIVGFGCCGERFGKATVLVGRCPGLAGSSAGRSSPSVRRTFSRAVTGETGTAWPWRSPSTDLVWWDWSSV